jgi:hypothetical protein
VAEKHDFCDIQQKILQISDFATKRDLNPPPHGDITADIAKMFAKKYSQKSDFGSKNTIFAIIRSYFHEIPRTVSQKSDSAKNFFLVFAIFLQKKLYFFMSAKIGFHEKLFQKSAFFAKNT